MAKLTTEDEIYTARIQRAVSHEHQVRSTAKVKAEAMVQELISEAVLKTNTEIQLALQAGVRVTHIHKHGLGQASSKRVYDVKAMSNLLEADEFTVEMTGERWLEKAPIFTMTQVLDFVTNIGVTVSFWSPENADDPYESLDPEHQETLDLHRDKFAAAAKEYYDFHGRQ